MSVKGLRRRSRRILAFGLAASLFFQTWVDHDFFVLADPGEWNITLSSESAEYNGTDLKPQISVTDGDDQPKIENADYTLQWSNSEKQQVEAIIDAGTYSCKIVDLLDNQEVSKEFTVTPLDLSNCEIRVDESVSFVYSGTDITPLQENISVIKDDNVVSPELYDITVTSAGEYGESVNIEAVPKTGNSNATGSVSKSFPVEKKSLNDAVVTIEGVLESYPYTGTAVIPQILSLTVDGVRWSEEEYSVSYANNEEETAENALAQIILAPKEDGVHAKNYCDTAVKKFSILRQATEIGASVNGTKNPAALEQWYAGEVTLTAPEGYQISHDESQWQDTLVITQNMGEYTYYLKNVDTGVVSEGKKAVFYIDSVSPEIEELKIEDEQQDSWAKSKNIIITVNETNIQRVYYEADGEEKDVAMMGNSAVISVDRDISAEAPLVYTFYVIDKAGSAAEEKRISVNKIDRTAPKWNTELKDSYWKGEDAITVSLPGGLVFDEGSSIQRLAAESPLENIRQDMNDLVFSAPGEYTFSAEDQAGNTNEKVITIKEDTEAPEVRLGSIVGNDAGKEGYMADGVWWFGESKIKIPVTVTQSAEENSSYTVEVSDNEEFSNAQTISMEGNEEEKSGEIIISLRENEIKTYYIRAKDEAGNTNAEQITAAYDASCPEVTEIRLNGEEKQWVSKEDLVDGRLKVTVAAADEQTGIQKIEYSISKNETVDLKEAAYEQEGNLYTFYIDPPADGDGYKYSLRVTNNIGKSYDSLSKSFNLDVTLPEETVYIKFISDTAGKNSGETGTVTDGTWISKIWSMVSGGWNKIWGKKQVSFEIYVKDAVSGIQGISLYYLDTSIEGLQKEEGLKAFTTGEGTQQEAYTLYKGEITCNEQEILEIEDFKIRSLTDGAGNVRTEDIILGNAENKGFIYLDSVNPVLQAADSVHGDLSEDPEFGNAEKRYFSGSDTTVTLTVDERFFEESDKPVIHLWKRTDTGSEFVRVDDYTAPGWSSTAGEANKWQAEVTLPADASMEVEYQIRMDAYEDPSGNLLKGKGVNEEGKFVSSIFVVDSSAPLLTCTVNGETENPASENEVTVYKNKPDAEDVEITITITEEPEYFQKENLRAEVIRKENESSVFVLENKQCTTEGKKHTFCFGFDGEEKQEGEYFVRISYEDRAGNSLDLEEGCKGIVSEGIYESEAFIMDHVSPKLEVSYDNVIRAVNSKSWKDRKDNIPANGCRAYFNQDIVVTLKIEETYTKEIGENALHHHILTVNKLDDAGGKQKLYQSAASLEDAADNITEEKDTNAGVSVRWTKADSLYTAVITIPAKEDHSNDGDYQIELESRDCAGNPMEAKDDENAAVKDLITEGKFTAPVLILDTICPQVNVAYSKKAAVSKADSKMIFRDYFNADTNLVIMVTDNNIRYKELISGFEGGLKNGLNGFLATEFDEENRISTELKKSLDRLTEYGGMHGTAEQAEVPCWKLNLPLITDANYTIPVDFCDLAGNRAVIRDEAEIEYLTGYTEYATVDKRPPEISYTVKNYLSGDEKYMEGENGVDYDLKNKIKEFLGFFFNNKGGMEVRITVTDNISGVECVTYGKGLELSGLKKEQQNKLKEKVEVTYAIQKSFKDQVQVFAQDASSLTSKKKAGAFVAEAAQGTITFDDSATAPNREEGNEKYYNKDVNLNVFFSDEKGGDSGIAHWEVRIDDAVIDEKQYKGAGGEITYKDEAKETITALDYNKNNIKVSAAIMDNSGNEYMEENETIYNIDVTKPEIEVTYDNNSPANEKYYNKARIATVKITERNFDEKDVNFIITSTEGVQPAISGWTHNGEDDDTNIHTCTVAFEEDSDYTFTLEFEDMAGNKAEYSKVDEFTVDKTQPEMTVTYDNNEFLNEYYYNSSRRATIDIVEHNFDPQGIKINVTAQGTAGGASVSEWLRNGDHNIATVTFAADAEYTLDIEGVDLADNELEEYEQDHFIVDQTVPELEIFDIENLSANQGEVRPGIRYYDTNYDADGTSIVFRGYHNGVQEMDGEKSLQAGGLELKLYDIAHTRENDDLYTMEATVYDLAGNSSEASVMFSVNRFGSVYTFDDATNELVGDEGNIYTNKERDIVIVETNVDTLEFKEITCNLNGQLSVLKEEEDYSVKMEGNDATWKQYTYTIFEDNFTQEGSYIITAYSEDKAANTSDNSSKGKSVEFVIDKTSPSVLISGVENGGQYREDSHEMTLDIEDNILLAEAVVEVGGKKTGFNASVIGEADGRITMDIPSSSKWQEVLVSVEDAAGNRTVTDRLQILVTANLLIQLISSKTALYTMAGGTAAVAAAVWWFGFRKKKVRSDKE